MKIFAFYLGNSIVKSKNLRKKGRCLECTTEKKKLRKKWKMDRIKFRNLYSSKVHSGIYQEFEKISNNEMVKKREFI